ncbi:MAG: hypothetical protein FWG34_10235 [Oscillospiraceae bacterium]|nr:hypothetical protein [Oscillospiraceae bacterium]
MAAIEVNLKTLGAVREGIENYCACQDDQMRLADLAVQAMLSSDWIGTDAAAFAAKWADANNEGSQAAKFRKSLLEFGENLAACAREYQTAQSNAIDAAAALRS